MESPCCAPRKNDESGGGHSRSGSGGTPTPSALGRLELPWTDGSLTTEVGEVPRARIALTTSDRTGTILARWGVGRMSHIVPPGLYAVGNPSAASAVFVSANYKMSFDRLRGSLAGRDGWILVLDTKGINVWCAAGKGTFGTDEIVRRVLRSGLDRVVSHRTLVLPQLGAPGVAAHEVRGRTGFSVKYGPVRAEELPAYLDAGMIATDEMRRVRFDLRDRAVLVPVELTMGGTPVLVAAAALLLLGGFGAGGWSLAGVRGNGLPAAALVLGSFLGGAILGPLLLPWLPGRPFALKGALLGMLFVLGSALLGPGLFGSPWHLAAWALLVPALTSFVVMNFTGASTFTSLSGVLCEMRFALPLQVVAALIGLVFWVVGLFSGRGAVA